MNTPETPEIVDVVKILLREMAEWVDTQQRAFAKLMAGAIVGGPSTMEALSQEMKAVAKRMVEFCTMSQS